MREIQKLDDVRHNLLSRENEFSTKELFSFWVADRSIRDAHTVKEAIYQAEKLLEETQDYNAKIYLIGNHRNSLSEVAPSTLEDIAQMKIAQTDDKILFPLIGKNEIFEEINRDENLEQRIKERTPVIGAIVLDKSQFDTEKTGYLKAYAELVGEALHHGMLNDHYRDISEFSTRLTNIINHDIRKPMTIITSYLNLILEGELPKEMMGYVGELLETSRREFEEVLEYSNLKKITPSHIQDLFKKNPINFVELCKKHLKRFEELEDGLGKERTVLFTYDPKFNSGTLMIPSVIGDIYMKNLLENVTKYTPPKGIVWLGIHSRGEDPYIMLKNHSVKHYTPDELAQLGHEGIRYSDISGTGYGADKGIGLETIRTITEKGFKGKFFVNSQLELNISEELEKIEGEKKKRIYGIELEHPIIIGPTYELELTLPCKYSILK